MMDVRCVVNQQSQLICHMKQNDRATAEAKAEAEAEAKAEAKAKARARKKLTLQNGVCNSDSAA